MEYWVLALCAISLVACGAGSEQSMAVQSDESGSASFAGKIVKLPDNPPFDAYALATFDEPWAMTFLPDARILVTERPGRLFVVDQQGRKSAAIAGLPDVDYGGQGGLGDVVLHPDFANNNSVYISYAEAGKDNTRGAVVIRGTLQLTASGGELTDIERIWEQVPKTTGRGHYGHRIAFSPDGLLFISSGERQKFTPAQDMQSNLGKVVRLLDDGSVPKDNPFASTGGVTAQIWSLGHRNPLGLAFAPNGELWSSEMGPRHGDELNLVKPGNNYGYPEVSNGDHYSGEKIPDHDTRPEFNAPATYWVPAISPAGLLIYDGAQFADWRGNAFLGSLTDESLVRVELDGEQAEEVARYPMGKRIREVEQGPDGAIWVLEDGDGGRLLKLVPKS